MQRIGGTDRNGMKGKPEREKGMKHMDKAAIVTGVLCILYFIAIRVIAIHGTNFYFIWLFAGIALLVWGICMNRGIFIPHLPIWFRRACLVIFVLFLAVEGCILSGFAAKGPQGLDYIIVLGAQMKAHGPSRVLKMRLDKAYEYLVENPDTIVIVSGGQGADEHVSEAQGMLDYLVEKGIAPVGIVTNNFHIFRATHIAQKCGYAQVYGIAAPSELLMQGNNMLREFMGVMKDFLVGNI